MSWRQAVRPTAATIVAPWLAGFALVFGADSEVVATRDAGVLRVVTTLPGPVLDHTVHRHTEEGNALVLLVRAFSLTDQPDDCDIDTTGSPLALWRLGSPFGRDDSANGNAGQLVRMRADVDPRARMIRSVDIDGDGTTTLVTVTPGSLVELPTDGGKTVELLADRDLAPGGVTFSSTGDDERTVLSLAGLGRARFLRPSGAGQGSQGSSVWRELLAIDLHKNVTFTRRGLRLNSRPPVSVGESGGALHFATAPDPMSGRRLRGRWVAISRDEVRHREWWAGLPDDEEVLEHAFIVLGGEPALLVTTRPFRKLVLFGEKRLRLFRLREDRSRMGHPPFFAVQTRVNLWQTVTPYVRDSDGDGVDDLILAYWKGLKDDRIVLDVYRGKADGSLARNPRTTAFDVQDADRTFIEFGSDLDGDGVADLLLRTRDRLLVFAGSVAKDRGRSLVASQPSYETRLSPDEAAAVGEAEVVVSVGGNGVRTHEASPGPPRPLTIDLDGDGRHEVVTLIPLTDGRQQLTLLQFGRS